MSTKIFVNLPVKDLKRSMEFFTKIGYTFNPQFTDEKAACLVISEDIYAMLLLEKFFNTFIGGKCITDAHKSVESITALMTPDRKEVDRLADAALAAGGKATRPPEDLGFMYSRSFTDLDGHLWEIGWMDPASIKPLE